MHKLITCLGLYDLLIPAHTDKTRLVSQWQVPSRRPHRYSQLLPRRLLPRWLLPRRLLPRRLATTKTATTKTATTKTATTKMATTNQLSCESVLLTHHSRNLRAAPPCRLFQVLERLGRAMQQLQFVKLPGAVQVRVFAACPPLK